MNKIKTLLSLIDTANFLVKTILIIIEFIISLIIIHYTKHYLYLILPYFEKDYVNTKLIIENITLFDWKIETAKIWSEYIFLTIGNGVLLLLLVTWFGIGILGTISVILRILQYISVNYGNNIPFSFIPKINQLLNKPTSD